MKKLKFWEKLRVDIWRAFQEMPGYYDVANNGKVAMLTYYNHAYKLEVEINDSTVTAREAYRKTDEGICTASAINREQLFDVLKSFFAFN